MAASLGGGKDRVADIHRLKAEDGKPVLSHGGASFASSLIAANLVYVFYLVVHLVVHGHATGVVANAHRHSY